jgi:uncharacterized protein
VRILLAGASGFLGTNLRRRLAADGHTHRRLVRGEPAAAEEFRWDPYAGTLPLGALDGVDAVVNLAGAPIAHWPWTASYREQLLNSRVATTQTIATALTRLERPPPALVNASAVGYYGRDRGDEELTEDSARGAGFLADVVEQWEGATRAAETAGSRVVLGRTAVVLDRAGGALRLMRLPFLLGLGGRFGSGRQWFPSISLEDYLAAVVRAATDPQLSGPYNLVAPEPATNAELTKQLGNMLHRPTLLPVPAFALRAGLGELSGELLGSLKVRPSRLLAAGFQFSHPDIEAQLRVALA